MYRVCVAPVIVTDWPVTKPCPVKFTLTRLPLRVMELTACGDPAMDAVKLPVAGLGGYSATVKLKEVGLM